MATLGTWPRDRGVRTASQLIAALAFAMLAGVCSPSSLVMNGADGEMVAAADLVQAAADGQPVDLDGATIVGDLDLSSIETVSRIFRCTRCTFDGSIKASNVIFERLVDLSGAEVADTLDFGGAIFREAFLMRAFGSRQARVAGPVSFSLANFGGRAIFERAQFGSDADFRVVQFDGDASFADASMAGDARFDSATFAGRAQFNGFPATTAAFGGLAGFTNATFQQKADFRQRDFDGPAMFDGVSFDSVDFTLAKFSDDATFDGASINGSGVFRSTRFLEDLWFRGVVLRGLTDFQTVSIDGSGDFSQSTASDRFVLTGLKPGTSVRFTGMTAPALEMDLDRLEDISGDRVRIDVLSMIESGARARGNLDLANKAAYRRSQLQTASKEGAERVAWQASENVGGYLVQPLLPIRAMLVLVAIGTVVRTLAFVRVGSRRQSAPDLSPVAPAAVSAGASTVVLSSDPMRPVDPPDDVETVPKSRGNAPAHDVLLGLGKLAADIVRACADTLRAAVRIRPQDIPEERRDELPAYGVAVLVFVEWLAYKVLFALFLIGLANSNPTFKQLVEAVT